MDKFINNPIVQLNCFTFYINKKLPTYEQFLLLLPILKPIAIECELVKGDEDEKKLFDIMMNNDTITKYLSN